MNKTRFSYVLIIIFLIITVSSCAKQPRNSTLKPNESKQSINNIEGFEMEIIDIMGQLDLVPYYEKQIKEKKKQEKEENKEEEKPVAVSKAGGSEGKAEAKDEEFKAGPITNNDVILLELLEQEKSYKSEEQDKKIPDEIIFIWHEINEKINQLHLKWDDLKAELKKAGVLLKSINGFDDTLNTLTVAANDHKHLKTLIDANKLTLYMSQFIKELNDNKLASIYYIKYYIRQIVLNVVNNNYMEADKNFNALKNKEKDLSTELGEKEFKELLDKLNLSIINLENALALQDINVIKIKGSIIVKNINAIKEKL